MSAQHTPGPWKASRDGLRGQMMVRSEGGYTVARAYTNPELYANARLIASAPDLLTALEGVINILGSAESNASGNPEWYYVGPRVAAARRAIAKATGSQVSA